MSQIYLNELREPSELAHHTVVCLIYQFICSALAYDDILSILACAMKKDRCLIVSEASLSTIEIPLNK